MKSINWAKYATYMRSVIEAKYPNCSVVWVGENRFIVIKDGKELRIKYE